MLLMHTRLVCLALFFFFFSPSLSVSCEVLRIQCRQEATGKKRGGLDAACVTDIGDRFPGGPLRKLRDGTS